ncbi:MAG: Calx-beta domain-containing protein [Acidobacteriota bacterium]
MTTNIIIPGVAAQDLPDVHAKKNQVDRIKVDSDASEGFGIIESTSGFFNSADAKVGQNTERTMVVGNDLGNESEPNNTFGTANVLTGSEVKIRGDVYPNADLDWFSFTAAAGDRVYAAVMTTYSSSASTDSQLRIFASDGTTLLEFDEDDGSQGTLSSTIAGVVIPSAGTYYVQVKHFSATNTLRPYELYLKVQSGAPVPEVESNDTAGTANPLPASGWVSGARNPAVATEVDYYSMTLNAGDTVYLGLDLDPERDNVQWNGRLGIALFGDANNQILVVDDGSAGSVANPLSEAMFLTVKTAGTYYAYVDSATATTGGPTATYNLSVTVIPKTNVGVNCTTYTSTNVPQTIGPGAGLVSSTLTVPPTTARIASTKVSINATHALMADLDVNLRSPNSNNNGLFNDIGSTATGGQTMMDITLDQYSSGTPFTFTALRPVILKPELNYRLDWFDGENPSGVWTLDVRDDLTNTSGGTLNSWSLELCEQPPVPGAVVYSENFEANNGGYTLGTVGQLANEWEYGTPATVATTTTNPVADFIGCNSGTSCWKTDLDNTYDVSSNQDLVSPDIVVAPNTSSLNLSWAMRYQMESSTFDHAWVQVDEVGGLAASKRVWEWKGATMTVGVGSPTENIGESAGWGIYNADISEFATGASARTFKVTFHVDTDTSINFGGLAIDDVAVRGVVSAVASCSTAGPIEIESTGGTMTPTAYATLKDAFDAINAGTHTGSVNVKVCANTTETATASLNASGTGSASYTNVTVRPVGGSRVIDGTITGAIIKLNGADNVTIDGRQNGLGTARDLAVRNASTVSASAAIWLSSLGVGAGAMNNVVRNLEIAGGVTNINTNSTFGIIMSGVTISTTSNGDDNDNNQFIFNRIIRARYGIVTRGVTTNLNIAPIVTDNIIGPSAFGADQIGKTGILMQADTGGVVSRNTVQFVGGDLASTTAGADRIGIGIGTESWSLTSTTTITSDTYTVTKNVIHDIAEERTFSSVGILLGTTGGGSPTNNVVANNFIYNVRANSTSPDQLSGIGISGGLGDKVVFNSISLTGDQDPGATTTSTIFGNGIRLSNAGGATHGNLTLADNSIYIDASSNNTATTRYYAITGTSSAYSFGTGFENYNNYYINPANTQLRTGGLATVTGASATTEFATLANWQAAYTTTQDAASIQANPNHASVTSDLHLIGGSPNIDTGLTIAGVTEDIDAQARPNGAAPDIGADEFYAAPGSLQLSSANYAGSEGTTAMATVNRVGGSSGAVGVTYTLANGTATGGAACTAGVDYINPGPQVLSFGDTVTSQPVNVMLCTDAVLDPSETFTITLSLPTGGATLGSPTVATVTITDIPPPFNGTYTVGTAGIYPSLTNTGGIFEAINLSGATGNITINITSDLTGETGTHALNELAGGFTVLIKPSGAPRSISGSSAVSLIKLSGADNVRIDGSTAATFADDAVGGNPALRQLTITNAGTGALIWIATNATSGATGNIIRNLNLVGPGGFAGQGIIAGSGATFGAAAENGRPNSNNTVDNTTSKGVQNAIFVIGDSVTLDANWVITQNDFGSAVAGEKLSFRGIAVQNAQNFTISQNRISGVSSSTTTSATMSGILVGAALNAGSITRNNITDIRQNNTVGWGSNGIYLTSTSAAANVLVANNFVSGVASNGFAGVSQSDNGYGIMVNAGGGYNIYFNSVNMNTNQAAAGSITAAINIASAVSAAGSVDLRNNVLSNTQTVGTRYGAYVASNAAIFPAGGINFNDYFAQNVGFLTSARATLGDWQTATGQDANSQAVDPLFVSPTDLHLQPTSPVLDDGTPIGAVVDDIDGETRSITTPDIGADELVAMGMPGVLQLSSATYSVGEGAGNLVVTVNRTGGTDGAVSVAYTLSGGTATGGAACTAGVDYINTGGTASFINGQASQTFMVPICEDAIVEGNETFNVTLGMTTGGATVGSPSTAVVTIVDNDVPPATFNVSISDVRVTEGNAGMANAVFNVTLTSSAPPVSGIGGIASVQYATANGTATAGSDYTTTSGTINFNSTGTQTVSVSVLGDVIKEQNEFFFVNLSNPSPNTTIVDGQGAGVIVDDDRPYTADFDRDLKADFSVFRPSTAVWYVLQSSNGANNIGSVGPSGMTAVPGDYDGDGKTDFAVWQASSGNWFVLRSSDSGIQTTAWGVSTDKPVQGDYDGDGKTDIAVFRPSNGTWYVIRSSNGTTYGVPFGISTDRPVQGDYDGDFKTDVAVYRNGTWYIARSSDGTVQTSSWGLATDKPIPADFDGDGRHDLAIYRDGVWWIANSLSGVPTVIALGTSTDIPAPADYDGDGITDIGVFRPSSGDWYVLRSSNGTLFGPNWGVSGDVPVPSAYLPQ